MHDDIYGFFTCIRGKPRIFRELIGMKSLSCRFANKTRVSRIQPSMFRFLLRPNLLRRSYPLRARLTPGPLARTTLATLTLSIGAITLHADASSTDSVPEQHSQSNQDQPPLTELLRAYLVFSLCSFPSLVDASPRILSFLSTVPVLRDVSEAFLRVTFFKQVCP